MAKLTKTELMALDLAIQVMKDEQLGIKADPEAIIGGITAVTRTITKATPVLRVTTQVTPTLIGARPGGKTLELGPEAIDSNVTLDSLIALRESLGRD